MGQGGMGEAALAEQRGVFVAVQAEQVRQKEAEHASNALASLLSGMPKEPYINYKRALCYPQKRPADRVAGHAANALVSLLAGMPKEPDITYKRTLH